MHPFRTAELEISVGHSNGDVYTTVGYSYPELRIEIWARNIDL